MLNGVVIKGAPSLGTKFNPNFRDPVHAPCGKRPQSRGLTQGNIIQIASKALASIHSPKSYENRRRNRFRQRNGSLDQSSIEPARMNSLGRGTCKNGFIMQGKKKEATTKKVPERNRKDTTSNGDIA
jgi:hypothetical protein